MGSAGAATVHADHHVQFYENDDFLCDAVARFVRHGLLDGLPVLMLSTDRHRKAVSKRLGERGHDFDHARSTGQLVALDAHKTLSKFMVDNMPDEGLFDRYVGGIIESSLSRYNHLKVHAYGEMVDVLWQAGNVSAAIRLEELWNELAQRYSFNLLCAYSLGNFYMESNGRHLDEICNRHAHVMPGESFRLDGDRQSQARQIVQLQQRAAALEKEIEHRRKLETALREAVVKRAGAEAALRASEHELKDFLENAVEGLHWVGPDGVILWANRAELDMLGYRRDEYVGRPIVDFHADRDAGIQILALLTRGDELRECETSLRCKDGSIKHVLLNSNVLWEDGKFMHTRCFTRDITERKNAEEALRSAKEEAERASRVKSDFLAIMSHELRTPLNAIIGYQDLLVQRVGGPVTESQQSYLERIRMGADQLLGLIDQVLSLSRIEAGKERIESQDVDLAEMVRDTVALVEPIAAKKGLTLALEMVEPRFIVLTDAGKVRQILLNLLSNAVKFTAAGGIMVRAARVDDVVCIDVHDTGIGIDAKQISRIFEPFVQLDASATREHGGTGLGLAVSRDLARLLGGELVVQSAPGQGTVFTFTLPARAMPLAEPVRY